MCMYAPMLLSLLRVEGRRDHLRHMLRYSVGRGLGVAAWNDGDNAQIAFDRSSGGEEVHLVHTTRAVRMAFRGVGHGAHLNETIDLAFSLSMNLLPGEPILLWIGIG